MKLKSAVKKVDVLVLGGGSAGYAAARTALTGGATVCVVEGGRQLGGLCILRGCMPTKALIESSRRWHEIQRASQFGLKVNPLHPDWSAIVKRKNKLIAGFAAHRIKQLSHPKLNLIRGNATFIGPNRVVVTQRDEDVVIEPKTVVIATGSEIQFPEVKGIKEAGCWTSDDVMDLKHQPKSIVVLGGGAIACEFAQFFAHLGTQVTQVQRSPNVLRDFDPDVSQVIAKRFKKDGIQLFTGTELIEVKSTGKSKIVVFRKGNKTHRVQAEGVLCALGRKPATDVLGLEAAGVEMKSGAVKVGKTMVSSLPHVFAAGDVTGLYEVVHIAIQQAEVAAHNALAFIGKTGGSKKKIDYRLKTSVVFTDPEVAHVGLTEAEAIAQEIKYRVASYPFFDHGKSMIHGCEEGFVKLMVDSKNGEILSATIVGMGASDLIHEMIAVMNYRGTARELALMPHYHPTLAEILTYPAEELMGE